MPYLGSAPAEKALEASDIASDAVTTAKIANDAVDVTKINLISTSSVPSVEAKGDGSSDGYIQLNCSQNSHGIKLKSPPHSAGQSYTLTYPQSVVDGGFMKTDSSGNLSFASASKLVARYYAEDTAHGSTTTQIPGDDTIPQSGEGTQVLSITTDALASSSNRIRVFYGGSLSCSSGNNYGLALFVGGSGAVHSTMVTANTDTRPQSINGAWEYAPGATTALTISVRYGGGGGTTYKNGHSGGRQWGGSQAVTLIVEEIEP